MTPKIRKFSAALILLLPLAAHAVSRDWPGVAPCNGTLQACIDASSSGDIINVLSSGDVGSPLNIDDKSLRLIAPPGVHPEIGSNGIHGSSSSASTFSVRIEGFTVRGGIIDLAYYGSGTADFRVVRNQVLASSPEQAARISLRSSGSGTLDVLVDNNFVRAANTNLNYSLIEIESSGGTVQGKITSNRIEGLPFNDNGWGIGLLASYGATMDVAVGYNTVHGRFNRGAIGASEGLFSSTPSSLTSRVFSNVVVCGGRSGKGITTTLGDGDITMDIALNTVVTCSNATLYSRWSSSTGGGSLSGILNSNLLAFNSHGYYFNAEFFGSITRATNLLYGNGSNQPAPEVSDVTSDPQLYSIQYPYLGAGSPAINAGNALVPISQAVAGLDNLDADGLRRIKDGRVDIGAYEYGDSSHLHTATVGNTSGNVSRLGALPFGLDPSARPFATPQYVDAPAFSHPFGVYFSSVNGDWSVFSEDTAPIEVGTRFNLFAPEPGTGVFVHESSAASVSGWYSQIDNAALNDNPDAFVLVTQDWLGVGSGGAGIYNAHPIGASYFSFGGPGSWLIWNIDLPDLDDMPEQARFHVYTQDRSPNAFVATATEQTRSGQTLWLDHPLLNGTPCALVQATRLFDGVDTNTHFDLRYSDSSGRWSILQQNEISMPLGRQYSVLVNPRQVQFCRGDLFNDGFE